VAATVGLPRAPRNPFMTPERAIIYSRLAMQPSLRGQPVFRATQAEATHVVAQAISDTQDACRDRLFLPRAAPAAAPLPICDDVQVLELPVPAPVRVHVLSGQWDETSQKVRAFILKKRVGELASKRYQNAQVMMAHHTMGVLENMCIKSSEPYFTKGRVLLHTTSDFCARAC